MKEIFFITSNKGKVQEATEKLRSLGFLVVQKDLGYPEVQADSLEEVAIWGVSHVQKRFDSPFILEDAGLFIDALQGFPGVYSKYVFFTIGLKGILQLLEGVEKREAVFRSVYAYCEPKKKPLIMIGECKGIISTRKQGTRGFGYDPIFIPDGAQKTFGDMTVGEKNRFSHRGRALEKLVAVLRDSH
jgi:XTP/dITP diphosphohydrolase